MNRFQTGLRVTSVLIFAYAAYNIVSLLMNLNVLADIASNPANAAVVTAAAVLVLLNVLYLITAVLGWRCAANPTKGRAALVLSCVFAAILCMGVIMSAVEGNVGVLQVVVFLVFLVNTVLIALAKRQARRD